MEFSLRLIRALSWKAALGIFVLFALMGSYYTVEQNEVGAVTRFGQLETSEPTQPGLHFKLPFVDTAHVIRTSLDKVPIEGIKAKTVDNQFVAIDVNLTHHTGDPFRVLFKVGDVGQDSINDKLIPYVQSRVLDEIGKISALQITDQKAAIEAAILKDIRDSVLELFGQSIDDVQITGIHYDATFETNIQQMVMTRNQQISAKNLLEVAKTQAQQAVAVASGQADAAVATAEGEKQRTIKSAEASARQVQLMGEAQAGANLAVALSNAEATSKIGQAESDVIKAKVAAAGSSDAYAGMLRAEAAKNWKGDVPRYSFGAGSTPNQIMMLPKEEAQ